MSETSSQSQSSQKDLIGSYFLSIWLKNSKTLNLAPKSEEEEEEELRTALDTVKSSGGFSLVGPDKLSVSYPTVDLHGYDVGVVQANFPAPSKRLLYYFEIHVKNAGAKGQIVIGFTTPSFKLPRQPGYFTEMPFHVVLDESLSDRWEANSYGYRGDDGMLYRGHGKGETFGPTFSTGDTVGCGINYASQEFFFTKNGAVVGSVYKDIKGPLFPTVSVHSQHEEVTVNFEKQSFVFDLDAYEAECREKDQLEIDSISMSKDPSYGIVRSYLQHYGYEETLNMLDAAGESNIPPISAVPEIGSNDEDSMYALNQRRTLRQLIRRGEIDETFSKLQEWYPQIVQVKKLEEAVMYGRNEFSKFEKFPEFDDLVKDCAALLAYQHPENYSVGYLLQESQKELLADAVNAKILSMNPNAGGWLVQGMKSAEGLSNFTYNNGTHLPVFSFLSSTNSASYSTDSSESKGNDLKGSELSLINYHHQRCSSESFLIEEQPSWLDDLLNDSETTFIHKVGHRRSASDSLTYFGGTGEAKKTFNISIKTKTNSLDETNNQDSEEKVSGLALERITDEVSSLNLDGSTDRASGSQVKTSATKTEAKRAKQNNAHRSRLRKLQYIAHLEKTVQTLQTEGSEVSAELEFLEQQNIVLTMENRALRQRLESISQEQMIKHWEQEMLEKEIARLQTMYHLQKQQQQSHPKQRKNRSRDLDQVNIDFPIKNYKDASSSKSSLNGSFHI
ncbi:hypothetical protein RD792_011089 [Penstemon davidsonii]|uniref:B30.2/SPRY domain-containing protein n=1 Tax=Penstemon davidsonii TaxID=160366 RepID=A0ABR0D4F9_9LAMI|nr:hypothetical protein RD792_011089 [Penstemon davidsonii]